MQRMIHPQVILFVACWLIFGSSVDAHASTKKGPKWRAKVEVGTHVDSNPFRIRDSWKSDFDAHQAPGGRFAGFESAADVVTSLGLEGQVELRSPILRRVGAEASIGHRRFNRNAFASYTTFRGALFAKPGKHAETRIRFSLTPDRFKKNYINYTRATPAYEAASMRVSSVKVSHRHRIVRGLYLATGVEYGSRKYESAFSARDRREVSANLGIEKRLTKNNRIKVAGRIGSASSDAALEDGILVDRSFTSLGADARLQSKLGSWRFVPSAEMRVRSYTTDEAADINRYNRSDTQWKIATRLTRSFVGTVSIWIDGAYTSKRSDRPGDTLDPDIVPYARLQLGGGVGVKL